MLSITTMWAAVVSELSDSFLGLQMNPALETPDLTGYDPVDLLCSRGGAAGEPRVLSWCKSWLMCIKGKAAPAGDADAVMKAWSPADCKEVCGKWPVVSGKEGAAGFLILRSNVSKHGTADCMTSCANFQKSLSSCVATIMFEPGKLAVMGKPPAHKPPAPKVCTQRNTTCLPDLPVEHQKCLAHKTREVIHGKKPSEDVKNRCFRLAMDMEDCKGCPQLGDNYQSKYHTFVGGCMDQLNAYWQATHPAAKQAAIPGATGCTVH